MNGRTPPSRRRTPTGALLALASLALGCSSSAADSPPSADPPPPAPEEIAPREAPRAEAPLARPHLDGRDFPDKVIALTWDDGPDAGTFELAEYLHRENVSATFFVVREWIDHLSSDPGWGTGVFETGHEFLPVLADLVGLGHRIGNHTQSHVLLSDADADTVDAELRENQERIDPYLASEIRLFRAPGGAWNAAAAAVVDADPFLRNLVGPIRWDVDRKDWESSVYCRSSRPAVECERTGPGGRLRVKPSVVARRYLASIEAAGHGIVLLHDRVGHVGSRYAIEIAEELVPQLKARGFVFAAPVLGFSPLALRAERAGDFADARRWSAPAYASTIRLGDVDGDGRADVCGRGPDGVVCATSAALPGTAADRRPQTVFRAAKAWDRALTDAAGWSLPPLGSTVQLADVNGDDHADLCVRGPDGIACAEATSAGAFGMLQGWSASHRLSRDEAVPDFSDDDGWGNDEGYYRTIRFGDVDGDGRDDVCGRSPAGVVCARSLGNGFDHARLWLPDMSDARGWAPSAYSTTIQLADVDGDGRDDLCGRGKDGIVCALSQGGRFTRPRRWSTGADFGDADACPWARSEGYYGSIRFGDLNGDGRDDVCGRTSEGVVCALSTGRSFTRATPWLRGMTDAEGWGSPAHGATLQLADVNGDGRADVCGRSVDGMVCGLSP